MYTDSYIHSPSAALLRASCGFAGLQTVEARSLLTGLTWICERRIPMKMSRVLAPFLAVFSLVMFLFFVGCSDDNHDNPGVRVSVNGVLKSGKQNS